MGLGCFGVVWGVSTDRTSIHLSFSFYHSNINHPSIIIDIVSTREEMELGGGGGE